MPEGLARLEGDGEGRPPGGHFSPTASRLAPVRSSNFNLEPPVVDGLDQCQA